MFLKKISILAILLLILGEVSAEDKEKKVALGLSFKPQYSWLQTNTAGMESDGGGIGFGYGLVSDINFNNNYAFATGLEIGVAAASLKYTDVVNGEVGTRESDYRLHSINIPLTLRMKTKEIGYFKYYGQFGLGTSYFYKAVADTRFEGGEVQEDIDARNIFASFGLSLQVGLGFEYNISGTTIFQVGAVYNNGFTDYLKGNLKTLDENGEVIDGEDRNGALKALGLHLAVLF